MKLMNETKKKQAHSVQNKGVAVRGRGKREGQDRGVALRDTKCYVQNKQAGRTYHTTWEI